MKARAVVTDSITASQGTVVSPEQARGGWLPTRRLVLYAALPAAVALCALVRTQAAWTALGIDILLAVACVADRIRTPKRAVIVERKVPAVLAIGRPNVITLRLKNDTGRTLSVEVNDDLFEGAVVRGLPGRVELRPFGSAELSYQLCPLRRGAYALGDHFVRYTLSGALLTRQERLAAHDLLRVYPDVLAVRQYESWARRGKEHLPGTATVRGAGAEFEQCDPTAGTISTDTSIGKRPPAGGRLRSGNFKPRRNRVSSQWSIAAEPCAPRPRASRFSTTH